MNFLLTIAEGKEAGREFVFDKETVTIGRSADCDVVLYDPGVSRRHAQLSLEDGEIVAEDSGSANGTKVNGELIPKDERRVLQEGDQIALGPVVFTYSLQVGEEQPPAEGVNQSTRIVDLATIKRQKNRGAALAPEGAEAEALGQLARKHTDSIPAVSRRPASRESRALARRTDRAIERASGESAAVARPVRERRATPARQLSAVERSRLKREARSGAIGSFKLWWAEASNGARTAVYGLLGLLAFGALAGIWVFALSPGETRPDVPEPTELTNTPIEYTFGSGREAFFQTPDKKSFDFTFVSATRAVVILHFQSRDIAVDEVHVTVNGEQVGVLPPDPINPTEVTHEILIPPNILKKAENNVVVFDNVQNPPGNESWAIWNVWMEVAPLPEQPPAVLVREARSEYDRGLKALESKDIGAANRYQAWRSFRSAWLRLEAHPDPKPELYQLSRLKVKEAQHELDAVCAKLLLQVERAYNLNDYDAAMSTLEHIREFFPARDQTCLSRADRKRRELQL